MHTFVHILQVVVLPLCMCSSAGGVLLCVLQDAITPLPHRKLAATMAPKNFRASSRSRSRSPQCRCKCAGVCKLDGLMVSPRCVLTVRHIVRPNERGISHLCQYLGAQQDCCSMGTGGKNSYFGRTQIIQPFAGGKQHRSLNYSRCLCVLMRCVSNYVFMSPKSHEGNAWTSKLRDGVA